MRMIKQNAIKIARLGLLMTIVLLAFAIVIAAPLESSTEVALAVDAQGGTAVGTYGGRGALTSVHFGIHGDGNGSSTWTLEEGMKGVTLDSSKISACLNKTTKPLRLTAGDNNNGFRFGLNEHETGGWLPDTDGWKACAVLNYQLSPFLKTMISNYGTTVQVTKVAATLDRAHGNSSKMKAVANSSAAMAATYIDEDETGYQTASGTSAVLTQSSTITLKATDNVISIVFYVAGGAGGTSGDNFATGYAHDINITFKITRTQAENSGAVYDDGAAPKLQAINSTSPFRTDATADSNWNYALPSDITTSVEEEIKALYNQNIDRVDTNNNVYLHSYINPDTDAQIAPDGGPTYYKYVKETFVDQFSYGTSTVTEADGSGRKWHTAGIKHVQVGTYPISVWEIEEGKYSNYYYIQQDDGSGTKLNYGKFRVKKLHRGKVEVEMYFFSNVDTTITVSDFGSKQIAKSISVKGIDVQANSKMEAVLEEENNLFMEASEFDGVASWDNIGWHYSPSLTMDFDVPRDDAGKEVEREANQSPYIWFYSVVKADSPTMLTSASWGIDDLLGKKPFAVNGLKFTYDFSTGLANGEIGNQADNSAIGSGYYLFTFYKMTLSGKFDEQTGIRSYYVKVDYEAPVHTLNKTTNGVAIDNPQWAAGAPLVITLTQDKPNISGNTLAFITMGDNDIETNQVVYVKNGLLYVLDGTGAPQSSEIITLHDGGRTVYVDYEIDGEGRAIWTITFASVVLNSEQGRNTYVNYNYISTFELLTGVEADAENAISYVDNGETVVTNGIEHGKWQYLQGSIVRTGVYIRVDRNAPLAPNFMNSDDVDGDYIAELEDLTLPEIANRSWYTSGWSFPGQYDFSDDLVGTFGDEIKVYYAMKNITSADDFTASGERKSLAEFIADYNGEGYGHLSSYAFDMYEEVGGSKLQDINSLNLALDSKLDAGMRVLLFWTVDQAGNKSELHKYYILADANSYFVTGNIDNGIFDGQADVTMVSGSVKTAYKRGDKAVVEYAINDDSPYVPYMFKMNNGGDGLKTLWTTENPTSKEVSYDVAPVAIEGTTLTLTVDDNYLGKLQTQAGESLDVYFSFRELVEISVLNNTAYYAGAPIQVPFIISNENAKAFVEFSFEGLEEGQAPVNVGAYRFTVGVDTESYISVVPELADFLINKKDITISINNTTGVYGNAQAFGYTIEGLVGKDLEAWDPDNYIFNADGMSLPTAEQWILFDGQAIGAVDFASVNVGVYRLSFNLEVSDGTLSNNYNVKALNEARHTITQREIVVSVVSGGKVYGDNDGAISFTIDTSSLPAGINSENITDIIKNADVLSAEGNIITMSGEALITRSAGEDVGEYEFNSNASAFDTNANYKVVLDTEGKAFVITKRTVLVTPNSGQVFAYNEENNYGVGYTLDDYRFADALQAVWTFTQVGDGEEVGGFEQISMEVGGNLTSSNTNVEFILSEGVYIIVKKVIAGQTTIIISKVGGVFNKTYDGTSNLDAVIITADLGNGFEYVVNDGTLPEGFSIEFAPSIAGADVGNYMVVVDGADVVVYDSQRNNISSDYTIFVESYTVAINPAIVTVAPTFTSTDKVYGQMDTDYGFGYEVTNNGGFDSVDFGAIISGSFVRAIYQGASLAGYGARYDIVSMADGTFENQGTAYRYGVAVGNVFTSSNANFAVEVVDLSAYVLTISAKEIDFTAINTSSLYANDKVFNNSAEASFGEGEKEMMFDITGQLARIEDNVYVDFTALFTDFTAGTDKTVQYSAFILAGVDSRNYILVGADGIVFDITLNKNGNPIKITNKALEINRAYFSITKVYDGTSTITEDHIIIDSNCMLSGIEFYIANLVAFNGADVTDNFATDLVLMFVGITEDTFLIEDESLDEYVSFDQEGLKLSLSLIPGSITPKTIALADFVDVDAIDRVYNGRAGVDMTFNVKSEVFGAGDKLGDLGVSIDAVADSKDAGTRAVTINAIEIASRNYNASFTADEFTAYINADVEISRAVVELNVSYNNSKEYNGREQINLVKDADIFKGDGRYAFRLVSDTDMDGTAWSNEIGSITWDFDNVDFIYTIDGQEDASVAFRDGEVVRHNVKISGLTLSSTNPDALANYEIIGYQWNGEGYEEKSVVLSEGIIEDYECLEAAPMERKTITSNNSIKVLPKVYDGTREAQATAEITTEIGVAVEDIPYLAFEFDAEFDTKNVGEQKVSLRVVGFDNTEDAPSDIASNYNINSSTTWTTRQSILPAPMLIEANVGEKIYDGTNKLDVGGIEFTLIGKYAKETDRYSVDVLAGHYTDANVYDEMGNILDSKDAKLYGVTLRNISTGIVNYYPVFASATAVDGLSEITEIGALPATDADGNHIYYYSAKVENLYQLTESEYQEVEGTLAMSHFVDKYTRSGNTYYLFGEEANIQGKETIALAVDENAKGRILQREVTMIVDVLNKDIFNKSYDGTTIFHGVPGVDFDISMAAGFVGADGQMVSLDPNGFTVAYSTSKAGVAEVRFVFGDNAIAGVDGSNIYLNYTATGATYIVKCNIRKAEIKAVLDAMTATYGDDTSTYKYNINYSISVGGASYGLVIDGSKGYMLVDDYSNAYKDHWSSLITDDQNALRYSLADGVFTQDANGAYVVLPDTFVEPSMTTNATKQAIIGTYKASLEGGKATNYEFSFGYSRFENGVSVYDETLAVGELVIGKKTLKVSAGNGDTYKATYLESLPTINLAYTGFVGNDGTNKIKVTEGATAFKFFNGTELVDMPESPIPSSKLEDGQYYVAVIDTTKISSDNYIFEAVGEARLNIVMPAFTGVTVNDSTVKYNGQSQVGKVSITGNLNGVSVEHKYYVGSVADENLVTEVKNAGNYIVVSTFTRTVGEYPQSTSMTSNLTIEKIDMSVSYAPVKLDYQEKNFINDIKDEIKDSIKGATAEDKELIASSLVFKFYRVYSTGVTKAVSKVESVDNYMVEVILAPVELSGNPSRTELELAERVQAVLANYNEYTFTKNFKIEPAHIIITILEEVSVVADIDEEGNLVLPETLDIVFKYDFTEDYKAKYGLDADDITERRFAVKFDDTPVDLITGVGAYGFTIQYLEEGSSEISEYEQDDEYVVITIGTAEGVTSDPNSNYVLSNNVGRVNVTTKSVGKPGLSMEYTDGTEITNPSLKLQATEITEYVESNKLYDYWLAIESHEPYIKANLMKANLEVIMQLRLMSNNKVVQPGKEVQVTVNFFLEYPVEEYEFYIVGADGMLHRLEDFTITEDGILTFKTSHIDSVAAFRMVEDTALKQQIEDAENQLPPWLWYVVGGVAGLIVVVVIIVVSVVASKKKKGNGTPGDDKPAKKEPKAKKQPAPKKPVAPQPKPTPQPAPQPKVAPAPQPQPKATPQPQKPVAPQPKVAPAPQPQPKAAPAPQKPVAPQPSAPTAPQRPVTAPRPQQAPQRPMGAPQPAPQAPQAPRPQAPGKPATPPVVGNRPAAPGKPSTPPVVGKK